MAKKKSEGQPGSVYLVAQRFVDKDNFSKAYEVGEDVSHLDETRLEDLISKGLVELA
jgi:hypothetical protein